MKKRFFYLLVLLSSIMLMSACSQIDDPSDFESNEKKTTRGLIESGSIYGSFFSSTLYARIQIAQWFAQHYTLEEAHKIHNAVSDALSAGLDEIYYLKEYTANSVSENKVSKEQPTEISKMLRTALCELDNLNTPDISTRSSSNPINLFNHERLEIYWPYSDKWDGTTTPVVAYAPTDLSSFSTEGYILINGTLQRVTVTEEYCMNHPVWLITENETPYNLLPNFTNGEMVSPDGILYSTNDISTTSSGLFPSLPKDTTIHTANDPVATVKLGYVRSEKNHDSWIAGGSEYVFRFMSLTNTDLKCENDTSKCVPDLARTKVCFTRDQIKKKTQKEIKAVAVSDWKKSLDNIVMTLVEEDGGSNGTPFEATINVTFKGKQYGIEVSIPRFNLDDLIATRTYARTYIFTSNNKKGKDDKGNTIWSEDYSDEVYWTLPYEIGIIDSSIIGQQP